MWTVNSVAEVHKFPVMIWRDRADHFTGALADAEGAATFMTPVVAYGKDPRQVLSQIKDYLNWYYKRLPYGGAPSVKSSKLVSYKVRVRPEYRVGEKIFPYERNITLKVHVVDCLHEGGMKSAVIPRFEVEFFYTQGQLRDLVRHYVQEKVSGFPPKTISRLLPPEEVFLETVTVKGSVPKEHRNDNEVVRALSQVAEPLGTKSFKSRYSRPFGRDGQVKELVKRLSGEAANVLLVGEKGSGKTSVLLEAVRKLERRESPEPVSHPRRYWVTRGARVIAGMRYLGQWEERLEEVIRELIVIGGVLCLEGLQEIIQTGGRGPEGGIAAFLMPYVERGEITLVAEASPRELEVCRRLNPGFVDLFGVLPVPEFTGSEARAVLGQVADRLEQKYRISAEPGLVGECYRLHKRFLPYQSFPGSASQFLAHLFEECSRRNLSVDRGSAVEKFSRETGLPKNLLKDEELLPVDNILDYFHQRVVGQEAACKAVTGLVSTFKAGLNDPERPLGVLLFCGPTGVGKTEMAKTVSRFFFGAGEDQERMLRLDMSEYGGPGAAQRLMGDKERPGELVRRIRRQPFSVLLLDEVEKAHHDVFDLLLGVFDEGRLTDPWGRETNFRSAIIILTSNLGVASLRPIGINQSKPPSYHREIQNFFRPEFFNRIDSVVTFDPLQPQHIRSITEMELRALSEREGLKRRDVSLTWSEEVVNSLSDRGYDARYGARPLKRLIEQEVTVPLSRFLVEQPHLRQRELKLSVVEGGLVLERVIV